MAILSLCINPALDKSTVVDHILSSDKLHCQSPQFEAGGGGINVARVVKRLGGEAEVIMQSAGPAGEHMRSLLEEEGIAFNYFESKAWTRENFIVLEESSQEQFRFGMPGPELEKAEWEACIDLVKKRSTDKEYLVLSGSLPPSVPLDFYGQICKWANEQELKVIIDTNGAALKHALEEGVFLIKPNLKELGEISGEYNLTAERAQEIAVQIVGSGKAQKVVVSLGENGAFMASKEGITHQSSPKIEVKSAVGAGDSMVAGMAWALSKNLSDDQVLKYGVACGTAAATTPGTQLCTKDGIKHMLDAITN